MIADTVVRADGEHRYCLNDLHRAAGGKPGQRPVMWLRSKQARELIAEVDADAKGTDSYCLPLSTVGGRHGGTYACDDLLIAYANWISPKFYLRVIRAFKGQLGISVKSRDVLIRRKIAYEKREAVSRAKASDGGRAMAQRRHELPSLREEEAFLLGAIQPGLFLEAPRAAT